MSSQDRLVDYSIELDCPPGSPRPYDLIDGVLEGTGLQASDFETGVPFFGNQIWILTKGSIEKDALFTRSKPIYKERITKLYRAGLIRYGSW